MKPQIPWLRVFVEGVVIVGSILLAFGIQAWWEGVQERELERDALERLVAEFVVVDSVLAQYQTLHLRKVARSDALLGHTRPGGSATLTADSVATLVAGVRIALTIDLPLANAAALEASGQFAAVRSHEVLTELSRFRGIMVDLQEDEATIATIIDQRLNPYLYANIAVRNTPLRVPYYQTSPGQSAFPGDLTGVLGSREFENMVIDIGRFSANSAGNYDAARQKVGLLLGIVRRELGRS